MQNSCPVLRSPACGDGLKPKLGAGGACGGVTAESSVELEVDGASALDVVHRPSAYAALHGRDGDGAEPVMEHV